MADLVSQSPLGGRSASAGEFALIERSDIAAWLVVAREPFEKPGAIALGPSEWLIFDDEPPPKPQGTAMVRDLRSALGFIEARSEGVLEALGIAHLADGEGGGFATRIADLRVIVRYAWSPETALLMPERPSADYLWAWLVDRLSRAQH